MTKCSGKADVILGDGYRCELSDRPRFDGEDARSYRRQAQRPWTEQEEWTGRRNQGSDQEMVLEGPVCCRFGRDVSFRHEHVAEKI